MNEVKISLSFRISFLRIFEVFYSSARNVFEERRHLENWRARFRFKRGNEGARTVSISEGGGDPHFLEGPWPSNKSWYRKQPLLVPKRGQYLYSCLACFTLRVARGHFEVDRSTKLNVTVVPRVIYLASHDHQEKFLNRIIRNNNSPSLCPTL